jgi:hypothetical protein
MKWIDEIAHAGPKDIYEKATLALYVSDALEFLVSECQQKDRLISIMAKLLRNEAGEDWWHLYADHIVNHINESGLQLKCENNAQSLSNPTNLSSNKTYDINKLTTYNPSF